MPTSAILLFFFRELFVLRLLVFTVKVLSITLIYLIFKYIDI